MPAFPSLLGAKRHPSFDASHRAPQYKRPNHGQLTGPRIEALEQLKEWVWEVSLNDAWMERLKELKEFRKKHGHCQVPRLQGTGPGSECFVDSCEGALHRALGRWVSNQRYQFRQDGHGSLTAERIELLSAVSGWVWSVKAGE